MGIFLRARASPKIHAGNKKTGLSLVPVSRRVFPTLTPPPPLSSPPIAVPKRRPALRQTPVPWQRRPRRVEVHRLASPSTNMPARNKEQEAELLQWIEDVLGEKLPPQPYEDVLRDGIILCKLINKIAGPDAVKKIQTKGTNFQLMENIQRFQQAIRKYGVPDEEIFQTADLFERRNIPQVTLCLYALGRITQKHPEYAGPPLGPKMADENKRSFTEDQLRASEGQLNLQMGYNKGASQSGHGGFGNTRHM